MKKIAILFCAVLGLHAAPVGNAAAPQLLEDGFFIPSQCWVDFRLGYEGDFVGDGQLKQVISGQGRVDTFQQYTNAATVTLNVLDRLDLFAVFGSSRVCSDWRFNYFGGISRIQLETFYQYLWGIGGRGILWEWGASCLELGGRYARCNYKPCWITSNAAQVHVEKSEIHWKQWQFDLAISYKIEWLIPYIGIKYSRVISLLKGFSVPISRSGTGTDHFTNKTPVGAFLGCSFSNGKYFMLNVEGRFFDEQAATISGDLRF